MIISDCHNHTGISSDSDTPMSDMIRSAIKNNIQIMCITEHMDFDFPKNYEYDFVFDPCEYFRQLEANSQKFAGDIKLLKGVELGLKENIACKCNTLLNDYKWDFVIGSIHLVDDMDPYYDEYWNLYGLDGAIKRYFETMYNNINEYHDFDALGHLDYVLRYAPGITKDIDISHSYELIDEILKFIIKKDIALEVNTSGYKTFLHNPNPSPAIIKRYRELGGKLITIGSDAHSPEYIGFHFEDVKKLLNSLGIYEYAIFENRKPDLREL